MAVYVTSDLHGLTVAELEKLLKTAHFCADDWLYILGDVVDRQNDGGVGLLKWLLEQPNAQLILGNHEAMLLACEFVFDEITDKSIASLDRKKLDILSAYIENGGDVTLSALKKETPETREDIFEYLREAPIYETLAVGERIFLLCHAGLNNFSPTKRLSEYSVEDFIWARPEIDDEYFENTIIVFGHTPTLFYDKTKKGKILRTKTWIDIDVGVSCGCPPALLRLDDLKEFYI